MKNQSAQPRLIQAVIFDMDGTLLDTERISTGGWIAAGEALGRPMDAALIASFRGNNDEGITQKMRTHFHKEEEIRKAWEVRNRYIAEQIDQYGVPPKKGMRACLDALHRMQVRICLATGSGRERAQKLCRLVGIDRDMEFFLCGDEVTNGKPAPDIYRMAAARLGLAPERCLVAEDSFAGVRSAASAGCPVVMIPDLDAPDEEIRGLSMAVLDSLEQLPDLIRVSCTSYT